MPEPEDPAPTTSALAVVGLVLGFVIAPAGLVVSLVALTRTGPGRQAGRPLAIGGVIVSLFGILLLLAVGAAGVAAYRFATTGLDEVAAGVRSGSAELFAEPSGPVAEPTGSEQVTPAPTGLRPSTVLELGESAPIGDYAVTVTGVDLDADEELAAVNDFNPGPTGRYVTVAVQARYTGAGQGSVWLDLSGSLLGADLVVYGESSCQALTASTPFDAPVLVNGATAAVTWCFDVPPAALADAVVSFQDTAVPKDAVPEDAVPEDAVPDDLGAGDPARSAAWSTR